MILKLSRLLFFFVFAVSLFGTEKEVVVVNNGWHSGVVFRTADIDTAVWPESSTFSDFAYIEVGWGDEAFYRSSNPGLWHHIKAALWPTPSVLHVGGYDRIERHYNKSQTYMLRLQKEKYDNMCGYIQRQYEKREGKSVVLGKGLFPNSLFYRSSQAYHIAKTCNVWTAEVLKEAGIAIKPMLSITTENLFEQLHDLNRSK